MRYLLALVFLLLNTSLFGQFRMIGNGTWTTLTDSTFSSTVTLQVDLTGMGYLGTQIVDSFRVFTGTEQLYDVIIVGTTTFSTAELTIQERGGDWGSPVGQVMVFNPDGKETLPEVPFSSIGSTGQMTAAVTTYNARIAQDEYVRIVGRRLFVDRDLYTGEPKIGDPLKPFRDPWQASESASPGDVIEILNGTYIAVDSNTMATYPNYDVLLTTEDPGAYNLMRTDSLTYHFNKGTAIQWSTQESFLAYDTLGYSLKFTGDGILYTTEAGGTPFNVQGVDTDQLGTLDIRLAALIDTRNHQDSIYDSAPRVFYLQNVKALKIDIDYIEGDHRFLAWDGELGTQTSDVYIRDWNATYSDYTFLVQGDTLRNQSHHIRIDNLNIEDFEYNWFEINRSYHWENTNITFDIENAFADVDSVITRTEGSNNTESLVFSWLGGAFWTTAVKLSDSNITLDVENCHSNVPLLQMIYAPDATEASNFNYRFKGNFFHNTDYAGSTGKGIYFPRSWTPPDGFNIYFDGNFISVDTATLIEILPGNMVFTGRFITQGSEPVISFDDASSGTIDMVDAHLFNDGTVAEVQAAVAKSINVYGAWNTTNFDADVTITRYPDGSAGGILEASNNGANIPTSMLVNAVDSFTIEGTGGQTDPLFKLKWDNATTTSLMELMNFDINTSGGPSVLTVADLIRLEDEGTERFRWRYSYDLSNRPMVMQGYDVDLIIDAVDGLLGFQADDYIRIGDGGEDSLLIKVDLPPIAVDSLMGKTPDGQVTMVAKGDLDNGIFSAGNDGGTVPTSFDVNLTDSLVLEKSDGSLEDPYLLFKYDQPDFLGPQLQIMAVDVMRVNDPTVDLTIIDPIVIYEDNLEVFRWRFINTSGDKTMTLQSHNGTEWDIDGNGAKVGLRSNNSFIELGEGLEDSLVILTPLPYVATDSIVTKTPSGKLSMVAKSDVAAVNTQYAQVYMTGGTNNGVDNGIPERINNTTVGTVTSIVATSEFTNEADGDIQYTGANNRVIKLTADISIDGALINDVIYCYIAINGTVVPTSRTGLVTIASDVDGNATINFIDVDADTNDTYAVYVEPDTGTGFTLTIIDVRLTAETLN